ncbi:MAG: hypothetical protein A3F16_07100 [Deltaproteobacteria bacterium RIFCSPHIGHO2_12_FULL_43_9]|nr:MAG: hypothetical protein A3F16_07100 [Deltaproteobacteria bacterium RIFCSPHIGHO2_12_FULL_43_9]
MKKTLFLLLTLHLFIGCASIPAPPPHYPTEVLMTQVVSRNDITFNHTDTGTPTVVGDTVFIGIQEKGLYAVDKNSGDVIWEFGVKNGVESRPTIYDGLIYFGGNDGYIYCVTMSGSKVWDYYVGAQIWSHPIVHTGIVYFSSADDQLYALDAKSGKYIWHFRSPLGRKGLVIRWLASPEISDHIVYIGFSDGYFYALNRHDGGLIWQKQLSDKFRFKDIDATAVVDGSNLYVSSYDGKLYSLDKNSGATNWFLEFGGLHPVTIVDDTLYYAAVSGEVFAIDKRSGKSRWVYKVPTGLPTSPVTVGYTVTVGGGESNLYGLDRESGEEIWRLETDNGFAGGLAGYDGIVYGFTTKSFLYGVDPLELRPRMVPKHGGIVGAVRDLPMIRPPK